MDLAPIPLGSAAAAAFPSVLVRGRDAERLRRGLRVDATGHGDAVVAALDEGGDLLALVRDSGDTARPVAVFAG